MPKATKKITKKRPIDIAAQESYSWWTKSFLFIKKTEIKTWQGIFIIAFVTGALATLVWAASNNYSSPSSAAYDAAVADTMTAPANSCAVSPAGGSFATSTDVTIKCSGNVIAGDYQWITTASSTIASSTGGLDIWGIEGMDQSGSLADLDTSTSTAWGAVPHLPLIKTITYDAASDKTLKISGKYVSLSAANSLTTIRSTIINKVEQQYSIYQQIEQYSELAKGDSRAAINYARRVVYLQERITSLDTQIEALKTRLINITSKAKPFNLSYNFKLTPICFKEGEELGAVVPSNLNNKCCKGLEACIPEGLVGTMGTCVKAGTCKTASSLPNFVITDLSIKYKPGLYPGQDFLSFIKIKNIGGEIDASSTPLKIVLNFHNVKGNPSYGQVLKESTYPAGYEKEIILAAPIGLEQYPSIDVAAGVDYDMPNQVGGSIVALNSFKESDKSDNILTKTIDMKSLLPNFVLEDVSVKYEPDRDPGSGQKYFTHVTIKNNGEGVYVNDILLSVHVNFQYAQGNRGYGQLLKEAYYPAGYEKEIIMATPIDIDKYSTVNVAAGVDYGTPNAVGGGLTALNSFKESNKEDNLLTRNINVPIAPAFSVGDSCIIDLSNCSDQTVPTVSANQGKATAWMEKTTLPGVIIQGSYLDKSGLMCKANDVTQGWPVIAESTWWCGVVKTASSSVTPTYPY